MKTFKVKNYKGNITESLKKFSKKYKDMHIIEAIEDKDILRIKAKEINEDRDSDFSNAIHWKPFKLVEIGDIATVTYLGDENCVVIKKTDVKGVGGKDKIRDQDLNEEVSDDEPVIVCQHFTDGKIFNYIYNQGISVPNSKANIKNITAI